jgi:hypothetical protein
MNRRSALLLLAPRLFAADAAAQVYDMFAEMASALSAGNAGQFLSWFDRSLAGYEEFRRQINGLLRQAQVVSSIELLLNEGTDTARTVEADWTVRLKLLYDTEPVVERREIVKCVVRKSGRRWRVFSFEPRSLFRAS